MLFGLCNALPTFQRAMTLILRGLNWGKNLVYLDYIIILGKSFDDSMTNFVEVLERFHHQNIKLKAQKCQLFQKEVVFLGKLVSSQGVSPNPSSLSAVQKWPIPSCSKDVESFLGFVNYHRTHIENFAEIANPLYELTKKLAKFVWQDKHLVAFHTLKEKHTTSPVFAFPRNKEEEPFILGTDASDTALSAEMLQVQYGVISYGSYALSSLQKNGTVQPVTYT